MDTRPLLSVIIPVYKVEDYLRQCVDSVIAQGLESYEIILVDDGSPDGCPAICDEYAKNNARVRVVHKENGGLSRARNDGIDLARGEYVVFMDSDDFWNEKVSVPELLERAKAESEVEMFLFSSLDFVEGEGVFKRVEHERLKSINTSTVKDYYSGLLANGNLEVSAATKIFKLDFIKANELYFKPGIKGEDNEWMIRVLRKLKTVRIFADASLYICRLGRAGSITNNIKKENITDLLGIVTDSLNYCRSTKDEPQLVPLELCFCSYLWFSALGLSAKLEKGERKALLPEFKKSAEVCKYSNSKKTKLAYAVYRVFGIRMTAAMLGKYISLKNKRNINKSKVTV